MSSHCADCRDYIAVQTARERADRAIAGAAPDEINFRPIGYATSEIYVGATRFGYIENVATAPQTPMVRCFTLLEPFHAARHQNRKHREREQCAKQAHPRVPPPG